MNCCLCKEEIDDRYSNNAEPVSSGRCCNSCNEQVVIPSRIAKEII